jgi:hypothetical protein
MKFEFNTKLQLESYFIRSFYRITKWKFLWWIDIQIDLKVI